MNEIHVGSSHLIDSEYSHLNSYWKVVVLSRRSLILPHPCHAYMTSLHISFVFYVPHCMICISSYFGSCEIISHVTYQIALMSQPKCCTSSCICSLIITISIEYTTYFRHGWIFEYLCKHGHRRSRYRWRPLLSSTVSCHISCWRAANSYKAPIAMF